jgi:saccharopine dehydrogenase-like NADP-dependent oxidoreductase
VRVALVGLGAVGLAAARQFLSFDQVDHITVVQRHPFEIAGAIDALGAGVNVEVVAASSTAPVGPAVSEAQVVVLATDSGLVGAVRAALAAGVPVVVAADDPVGLRQVRTLDIEARERGIPVVLGATMAPGLSCVLARRAAAGFDRVEEIHVASMGTGGPACARRHHRALSSVSVDWRDGVWVRSPAGSGRELVWFPEPVGGADCYRAGLADPFLLRPAFEGVRRVTARLEATRRDRLTSWLPMLRPPHPEGTVGAVRVDVRGWVGRSPAECILGASGRPAALAGTVAAQVAMWAVGGRLARPGVGGLAELVGEPGAFLKELAARGVRTERFEGSDADI